MRSLALVAAYAAVANCAPGSPPGWHWHEFEHPGWHKPQVYTPPGPAPVYQPSAYPSSSSVASATASASVTAPVSSAPASSSPVSSSSIDACASVSELVKSATKANPSATPTVPAKLAWECVISVPFKSDVAVELLDSIRPYVDWQTTIQYLKDPPAEYAKKIQPPYDFWANYERIYEKAKANGYANEREFGWDLYRCFQKAHDGHFVYYPFITNLIFSFGRTTPLVSVSLDGKSVPEVYVYSDILAQSFGNAGFTPSPLREIDGQDSTEFLLHWSEYGSLQDRDALWNNMFYLLAQVSLGPTGTGTGTFSGGGRGQWVYPGPTTSLTFANGTTITNENFARVLVPFDGIQSGQDLRKTYFKLPSNQPDPVISIAASSSHSSSYVPSSSSSSSAPASTTTIPAPGYPSPIIREPNNLNSGYFLHGANYDDVCVLSVPSFVGLSPDELDFQIVNTYTINACKAAGKTKLIIDVSANGGGTILQGYDLFKQLFPQISPDELNRFRAHEALDLIGAEVSWYSGQFKRRLNANNLTVDNIIATPYNYRSDLTANYKHFHSWPQKYGPHEYHNDTFTSNFQWNLEDPLTPINSGGIYVSGYLKRSNITEQPFKAEDIVIMYDGYCASTCTIFSELMRTQGDVKAIALGGRPNKDIIQAVGGVKGTNDYPYSYILYSVELPFKIHHYHSPDYYNTTALGQYNSLPLYLATNYVVNARDGIRKGDPTQTPLQFVYEPANCRIYYTPEMAVDQTAAWKTVADTAFRGINHCIAEDASATKVKRSEEGRVRHTVRRDVDIAGHFRAMSADGVWTGKGGITPGGDGFMPL